MPNKSKKKRTLEDDAPEQEPEEVYYVEKIMRRRLNNSKVEYFLKWKNYSESDNTWEPVENLNCPELIEEFERKRELDLKRELELEKEKKKKKKRVSLEPEKKVAVPFSAPSSSKTVDSPPIAPPKKKPKMVARIDKDKVR